MKNDECKKEEGNVKCVSCCLLCPNVYLFYFIWTCNRTRFFNITPVYLKQLILYSMSTRDCGPWSGFSYGGIANNT